MEKSSEVNCRPHTPRRFGTAHCPTTESVKGILQPHDSASDDPFKAPQYWDDSGKNFKMRPNSAPIRRPIPTPTIDQILECGLGGPTGGRNSAVDFKKQLPRPPLKFACSTTSPRDPSKAGSSLELLTRADALDRAAPQISPRTRGFNMSAALARSTQPVVKDCTPSAMEPSSPLQFSSSVATAKGSVSFKKAPSREQAQYAAGMGPPPTVCEYRTRLPKHAAAQCRTAEEEEYYLEVFVDEQDNQFTAGIAAKSRQRAKIVTRKRNMPSSGDSSHRSKKDFNAFGSLSSPRSVETRGVLNFGRMSGRDGVGEHKLMRQLLQRAQVRGSTSEDSRVDEPSTGNHVVHPPSTPIAPRPSARCSVTMAKTTGRDAPVSTTMPQPERGSSGCDAIYANATTYHTIGSSRVPTIDLSKLAARSDRPVDRTKDQCDSARLSYRVVDSQIVRRFPAAIM